MSRQLKLYGPPGTGKTTRLTRIAVRAVQKFGPDRVMATTFTRAAAGELKERIAHAMGYQASLPSDTWARRRSLDRMFPWIGTTHSLSLALAGRPKVMSAKDLNDFAASMGGRHKLSVPDVDTLEGYEWAEPGKDEIEQALSLYSGARHRMVSLTQAHMILRPSISVERAEYIASAYEGFKQECGKIDFEDMLEAGRNEVPPVDVILADEVQDNSPLLWDVIDSWAEPDRDYVMAGDPYQAIYLFSGAQPELFIQHPGDLLPLGDSHRLTLESAVRAQHILRASGYTEGEWLGTWSGVGEGVDTDGSEFWLARTSRLLNWQIHEFELLGVPYGWIRGGGPLETKAADAFRQCMMLRQRGAIRVAGAHLISDQMEAGFLPYGEKARMERLAKASDPNEFISAEDLQAAWQMDAHEIPYHLKHGEYFLRVNANAGLDAFFSPPKKRIGTIHSAKGKEADTVHLITSWATLPYQATFTDSGRRAEGCVAYVGTTRHRKHLHLVSHDEGTPLEVLYG